MSEQMGQTLAIKTVQKYVCAVCWGQLVWDMDGEVKCATHTEHAGYVTKAYADRRREQSRVEAQEVKYAFRAIGVLPNPNKELSDSQILNKLGF